MSDLVTYLQLPGSPLKVVDAPQGTRVEASGPIRHLCPYVDEVDEGTVTIRWDTVVGTLELHSLRTYLDSYRESRVSHEDVASLILADLDNVDHVDVIDVTLTFETAGFACTVTARADHPEYD